MRNFLSLLLVCAVVAVCGTAARATLITYDLSIEYSGATPPAGAGPWLRATFDDGGGTGAVTLTMTPLNLVNQEFVLVWLFNLDPALDPNALVFSAPSKSGTFGDPSVSTGVDAFQAAGDGLYDVLVEFDNAPPTDRFAQGDSLTYTITGIPTLTANSFDVLSTPNGGNGPFVTAAHVGGIGASGDFSGWVAHAPEPAALGLLGLALGAMQSRRPR